jgi:hypothetical protein
MKTTRRPPANENVFARWTRRRAERRALRDRAAAQVLAFQNRPQIKEAMLRARRHRQQRTLALLIAILLLLLLMRCECTEEPEAPAVVEPTLPEPPPPKKPVAPKRPKTPPVVLEGTVPASERDTLAVEPTTPPTWLPQFRLQAAARSPRLAACFNGSEKPGALRWSALVHARSGRVSESVIEPVFRGVSINDAQTDCLIKGLTEPPFALDEPDPQAAARRVSLIFEF